MDKRQLLSLGGFVLGSYATFHGHRLNKDCWLCQYRGIGWIMAIAGIIANDYWEKQAKEKTSQRKQHYYSANQPFTDFTNANSFAYSQKDTDWENRSEAGSDSWETASNGSDGSDKTVKDSK